MEILGLINAFNKPYACAFCESEGEKRVVWDAEIVENGENFCAMPGKVTKIGDEFVEVACGKNTLRLLSAHSQTHTGSSVLFIQSLRARRA